MPFFTWIRRVLNARHEGGRGSEAGVRIQGQGPPSYPPCSHKSTWLPSPPQLSVTCCPLQEGDTWVLWRYVGEGAGWSVSMGLRPRPNMTREGVIRTSDEGLGQNQDWRRCSGPDSMCTVSLVVRGLRGPVTSQPTPPCSPCAAACGLLQGRPGHPAVLHGERRLPGHLRPNLLQPVCYGVCLHPLAE